ncbi:MAG: YkgJ family cysteine cluster protein [Methanomassiliicoccales archaeon]|nr:YkgJ family cysteine cluster protein [Methanomassiliicoccales archaeon]
MNETPLPLDMSELEGRRFICQDPCKLCCLCQPECLGDEVEYFKKNYPERLVLKKEPHRHYALTLKKGQGSCSFLNNGRCQVYEARPHFCRQFPFHIHIGTRAQVELDLSCRGVWLDKGEEAMGEGMRLVQQNDAAIRRTLKEAVLVYREFNNNCYEAGIEVDVSKARSQINARLDEMTDLRLIASLLEGSVEDDELSIPDLKAKPILDGNTMRELTQSALEMVTDSLAADELFQAPVYCAPDGSWNLFRIMGQKVERHIMDVEGDVRKVGELPIREIKLRQPEGRDRQVLRDYIKVLNGRDSFMGYAFYLMDEYDYEDPWPNVYGGVLSTTVLDLLWRSALIEAFFPGGKDGDWMREGIIFYDMDRLDAPTLGAFI